MSIFAESFNMHGPGAVGDDLEKGICELEPCLCYIQKNKIWCYIFKCSGATSLTLLFFAGLTIMETCEADLARVVAGRQELANAEKLLDLPVTVYPEVISIQNDMKGLRQIYGIYKAQKVRCGGCR